MDTTPCPPYYAEPTHEQTLVFYTASYVRNAGDDSWYQCVEGAYCNAPSFLGYNPPGEGRLWTKAWKRLDEGCPCNPALEASSSFGADDEAPSSEENDDRDDPPRDVGGAYVESKSTERPTNEPTGPRDSPSLISGAVWYDANGDGRKNTLKNAASLSDKAAASKERGAGLSNMQVTLRECRTDALLGLAHTFPRSLGGGGGDVEVIDASYLESINAQEAENFGFDLGNDGLGVGNTEGELGYYSFRVLPFQLPGEFYVVFESPRGYRLTGGSGEYWEVYEAATYDAVQPSRDAPWLNNKNEDASEGPSNRGLQKDIGTTKNKDVASTQNATSESSPSGGSQTNINPIERRPKGPINHSGYYARSNCISIQKSPTRVTKVDVGVTRDSWPLAPCQYASLIVAIHFYAAAPTGSYPTRRRNRRQLDNSLECRKYEKLKSEGIEVEDIWGCEDGKASGPGSVQVVDVEELTLEEADLIAATLKEFLDNRIARVWTVKLVSLAHQEVTMLNLEEEEEEEKEGGEEEDEEGESIEDRRKLGSSSPPNRHAKPMATKSLIKRSLQGSTEIGYLELGFRVRAEYSADKSDTDLADIVGDSLRYGGDSFLSRLKSVMPTYFKPAGVVTVRDTLWKPEKVVKEESSSSKDVDVDRVEEIPQLEDASGNDGVSMAMLIGIIVGSSAFVCIVVGLMLCCRRKKKKGNVEDTSQSQHSPQKKKASSSGGNKKWWQRKKAGMEGAKSKMKVAAAAGKRNGDSESGSSSDSHSDSDYDDYTDDDLSSRFYSDSSKFDPEMRRQEVGGYSDDEDYDDYDEDLSSQFYSDSSNFDPVSRARDVGGYGEGGSVYSNEAGSQSHYSQGTGTVDKSHISYETESNRGSYTSSVSRKYSMRSSAASSTSSRRSHRSNRSSGSRMSSNRSSMRSDGSTIDSSMRSSGSTNRSSMRSSRSSRSRRTGRSSMRSSGRTNRTSGTSMKSSAANLYKTDRRWSAASHDGSSEYSTSRMDDEYSRSTMDSGSRASSRGTFA